MKFLVAIVNPETPPSPPIWEKPEFKVPQNWGIWGAEALKNEAKELIEPT